MKRIACLFSLLFLLAACGPPMVWDKPGLSLEAKRGEQTDCERIAWHQAVDAENDFMFRYRMRSWGHGSSLGYFPQSNAFDRYSWENRFYATCMQAKGYRLIPLQQGG
ncbi:MAG: hypothetical protein HQL45_06710 [Alphaproteobacteria bacterium]|nr:hypothetical protein [Alphaproteobacteria bacterium]